MTAIATQQELCANCGKPLSPVWRDKCHHCGAPMSVARPVAGVAATVGKTPEERRAILAQQVATAVATRRARIESQSDYQAVLVVGQRVNHVLHFLIGLFTLGLWWFVWVALALFGGEKRELVQVDEWGNIVHQRV